MAYNNAVPDPDNIVLEDLDDMKENFQLLESAQVVDKGTTVDGDYIRYENGWQICFWESANLILDTSENHYYTSSTSVNWTFPASFSGDPSGAIHFNRNNGGMVYGVRSGASSFKGIRPIGEQDSEASLLFFAIGRWK